MTHKEMREVLKEAGMHVPRSNKDVEAAYEKITSQVSNRLEALKEDIEEQKVVKLASSNVWTYIGSGDTPPERIHFMGLQWFQRGEPVEVTNPEVLKKIQTHRCFTQEKVSRETLVENDERAARKAQEKRERDVELQIIADRQNRKWTM